MFWLWLLSSVLLFVLVALLLLWGQGYWCGSNVCNNSPPSLPVIGHLHLLGRLPHRSLSALADRYGPLMVLRLGCMRLVVASSAEVAEEVLKTNDVAFASRPQNVVVDTLSYGRRNIALAPYGDHWRTARRLSVLHLLSIKRAQSFLSVREEEVALMVEEIRAAPGEQRQLNLNETLARLANNILCRIALGRKYLDEGEDGESQRFRNILKEFLVVLGTNPVGDLFPWLGWVDRARGLVARARNLHRDFDVFFERVLSEHEGVESDTKSYVDLLLGLHRDGNRVFTRESIKAIIMDLFIGGTDTVFAALEWTMAELIRNPMELRKVQEEIRGVVGEGEGSVREEDIERLLYLKATLKESLRLHPPLPLLLPRESMEDARVMGTKIPWGSRTVVNVWAIGRSPVYWEQPEEFRPGHFLRDNSSDNMDFRGQDFQLLPFGAGRRGCPGIAFAAPIVELALANLLHHFDWELPKGMKPEELDMTERPGVTVHIESPIEIIAIPKRKI